MATAASPLKLVPTAFHGGLMAHRWARVHAAGGPEQCADGGIVGVSVRARHLRAGI